MRHFYCQTEEHDDEGDPLHAAVIVASSPRYARELFAGACDEVLGERYRGKVRWYEFTLVTHGLAPWGKRGVNSQRS